MYGFEEGESIVKRLVDFATIDVKDIRELVAFGEDLFVIAKNANNKSQLWLFNSPLINNIEETNSVQSIKISPNPFEQETLLSFPKPISNGVSLKVYNPLGQQVETSYQKVPEGLLLNRSYLRTGMYFFEVIAESGRIGGGKLIVED